MIVQTVLDLANILFFAYYLNLYLLIESYIFIKRIMSIVIK